MTWFAASGDDGAADCDDSQNPGLAVDLPGSVPEVTSVRRHGVRRGNGHLLERHQQRQRGIGAVLHSGDDLER